MKNYTDYIEATVDGSTCLIAKGSIVSIEPGGKDHTYISLTNKQSYEAAEPYDEIKKALLWPRKKK